MKIGFPNVGKSSMLNALTRARAKVGEYSFTTIHPQVGVVEYADFMQLTLADLPGLLTDITRGFGTRYLTHLEKCSILVFVVDAAAANPLEQFRAIKKIIVDYNRGFYESKKKIIVANKVEELSEDEVKMRVDELKRGLESADRDQIAVCPISAHKRINLSKFLRLLRHVYLNK